MSVTAVAKKEFLDAVRSYLLVGLTLLFVLAAGGLAAIQFIPPVYRDSSVPTSTLALLNSMRQSTVFFVPMIGLGVGYNAVVGERLTGSLKLTLGLPNTRADVVVGKAVGLGAVVGVAVLVGYVVAGGIALLTYSSFDAVTFAVFTLLTVFYGAVYVAIAVGFSAVITSRAWAFAGASGMYALFLLGWDVLLLVLQLATIGSEVPEGGLPNWFWFVGLLNPSTAFMQAARTVLPAYREISTYPSPDAFYLQEWIGFGVLVLWIAVPLAIGYGRFARADLG